MITEFMVWEITLISLFTGILIGILGTIVGYKIMTKFEIMEKKSQNYDDLEQKFVALQKAHEKKED
jgi:uncharacterized membrane-anchored protein YhcB (DUF1043 family)